MRAGDTALDAYEHQNYTYGTLVRKLALPRDPSRLPLMEVQFNVEKVGGDFALPGLKVSVDPNGKKYANSDIFLNVIEGPDGLVLDCDFKTELFSKDTIRRWLGHFETLLEGLAADPEARVDELAKRARRDVETLVEKRYREARKALEQVEAFGAALELARENQRVRTRGFEEGVATSLDVVDARLSLARVQLGRLAAARDLDVALAELLEAAGRSDRYESLRADGAGDVEQ